MLENVHDRFDSRPRERHFFSLGCNMQLSSRGFSDILILFLFDERKNSGSAWADYVVPDLANFLHKYSVGVREAGFPW